MRAELRRLRRVALPIAGILAGPSFTSARTDSRRVRPVTRSSKPSCSLPRSTRSPPWVVATRRLGYRWFDLRDANSSDPSFEALYGVLRDDYRPKLCFEALRELIARLGATH
jgi:hypothetical protein